MLFRSYWIATLERGDRSLYLLSREHRITCAYYLHYFVSCTWSGIRAALRVVLSICLEFLSQQNPRIPKVQLKADPYSE